MRSPGGSRPGLAPDEEAEPARPGPRRTIPPGFNHLDVRHYLDLVAGEQVLYALIRTPSGLVRIKTSADAGNTWRELGPAFEPERAAQRLEVAPSDPDALFAIGPGGVLQVATQ